MLSANLLDVCVFCVAIGLASLVQLLLQLCPVSVFHRFNSWKKEKKEWTVTKYIYSMYASTIMMYKYFHISCLCYLKLCLHNIYQGNVKYWN